MEVMIDGVKYIPANKTKLNQYILEERIIEKHIGITNRDMDTLAKNLKIVMFNDEYTPCAEVKTLREFIEDLN